MRRPRTLPTRWSPMSAPSTTVFGTASSPSARTPHWPPGLSRPTCLSTPPTPYRTPLAFARWPSTTASISL
ncbi:hypothetical protein BRC21_01460 [Candidatus Saccharibacteria bacterium SW_7_54_9]|nr:MAG: hypothetical protein BRC21_01460 [Candidatus Saccharibacteria bacterium SW_7_54_9]